MNGSKISKLSILALLMLMSCAPMDDDVIYSAVDPLGKYKVNLVQSPSAFFDQRIRVDVLQGDRRIAIYRTKIHEVFVCFAISAWSAHQELVALAFRNCYGRHLTIVGYNLLKRESISPDSVRELIKNEIVKQYPRWYEYQWNGADRVSRERADPLTFAVTDEAYRQFAARREHGAGYN